MKEPSALLNEYDKTEWFDVASKLCPDLTQEEYGAMWDRFQQEKAAHQRQKEQQ